MHHSWVRLMYEFVWVCIFYFISQLIYLIFFFSVVDPSVSLHRRVKRRVNPSMIQFYGVGAYATSHVYRFVASVGFQ